jgi:hypothetical protein
VEESERSVEGRAASHSLWEIEGESTYEFLDSDVRMSMRTFAFLYDALYQSVLVGFGEGICTVVRVVGLARERPARRFGRLGVSRRRGDRFGGPSLATGHESGRHDHGDREEDEQTGERGLGSAHAHSTQHVLDQMTELFVQRDRQIRFGHSTLVRRQKVSFGYGTLRMHDDADGKGQSAGEKRERRRCLKVTSGAEQAMVVEEASERRRRRRGRNEVVEMSVVLMILSNLNALRTEFKAIRSRRCQKRRVRSLSLSRSLS